MSLYRRSISDNILIWQKRKWLPRITGWRWTFHRSDEDFLNTMRNELAKARRQVTVLQLRIPFEEDRVTAVKKALTAVGTGATSAEQRDRWQFRRSPVRLLQKTKVGRKPKDRPGYIPPKPPKQTPIAHIMPGGVKQ